MKSRLLRTWLKWGIASLVAIISVSYVLIDYQWDSVFYHVETANFALLLFGCGLTFMIYLQVRTLRWYLLARAAGSRLPYREFYQPTAVFVSISMITPGQIGEALKLEHLRRRNDLSLSSAIGSFMIERILDLSALILLAFISFSIVMPAVIGTNIKLVIYMVILTLTVATAGYFVLRRIWRSSERARSLLASADRGTTLILGLACTVLGWLIVAIGWQVALASCGVHLSTLKAIALMTMATLGILVSLVPAGFGVSEVLVSEALLLLGIEEPLAQAGALVLRLAGIWWLGIGLLHAIFWLLGRRQRASSL